MKTLTIAAATAITAMFAVDYASAQERFGLDEKTEKEIQAARRNQARAKARLKAESKPQPTIRPKSVAFLHRRPLTLVGGSSAARAVAAEIFFSTDRGVITVPGVRFLEPNPLRIGPVLLKDMPGLHFIRVLGSEKDAKSQSKRKKI